MDLFAVELKLRIDWSELDLFEHVNNVSYFKYIQAGRINYWETVGLTRHREEHGVGAMLASCTCDFKKALEYPGEVTINTRVNKIGNSSFTMSHELYNKNGELVAIAKDVLVMYDFNIHEKVLFPSQLKKNIEELQNQSFH